MNKFIKSSVLTVMMIASASALASGPEDKGNPVEENANRALVLKFYDMFFNQHNIAGASKMVSEDYKQHNPGVPDGKKPFVNYFADFFKDNPQSHARIIRSATGGDLVWLHVHSYNGGQDRGQSVVDIFRVKEGKIVEHWDVIQDVPEKAENKNTMF